MRLWEAGLPRLPTIVAAASPLFASMDALMQRAADGATAAGMAESLAHMERGVHNMSRAAKRAVVAAIRAGESDPYGDGDQSCLATLPGMAGVHQTQGLRDAWSTGLDLMETAEREPFHFACLVGDAAAVGATIAAARRIDDRGEAVKRLLERRVSLMRLPALGFVVYGARLTPVPGSPAPPGQHAAVLRLLLDAGAAADARDIAGYNAVASATGVGACAATLAMVPPLVAAGGDPCAVNRFGEPILMMPIQTGNVEAFKVLLRAGAAASLNTHPPADPSQTPARMLLNVPSMVRALTEYRRTADKGARLCAVCGASARQQCQKCRTTYYCGRDCQVADWKRPGPDAHKRTCGSAAGAVDVDVKTMTAATSEVLTSIIRATGKVSSAPLTPQAGTFKVKLQVPLTHLSSALAPRDVPSVKVQDKDGRFLVIRPDGPGAAACATLDALVRSQGVAGAKIYLAARWLPPAGRVEGGTGGDGTAATPTVLRLDTSKPLAPPSPIW